MKEIDRENDSEKEEINEPKEGDLLLVRTDSKTSKYDYRDILLLNDLDFFYKTGKFPFVFFFASSLHCFSNDNNFETKYKFK